MIVVDILAALIIAVLSGMGVGSGGLLVLYLTMVRDTPHLTAQGLNLLFFIFASGASLCIHLTRRQMDAAAMEELEKIQSQLRKWSGVDH